MQKPRVLFLCTGNSARSQMAEAFLRAYANDYFEVHSAGIEPKGYILPEVRSVMKEHGLDLSGQRSKDIREYLGQTHFAHVITVCADAEENCPTVFLNMGIHEHWGFDDPAKFQGNEAEKLEFTRNVRDQMDQHIQHWLVSQNIPLTLLK
ncbi:MAG TPA: arsenate reductase ArsC [Anaerolineales bacterium]|nr:arsenate reductase ArsC [Anaerolineales bacterium]